VTPAKPRLRCASCGLTYSQAAVAREITLAIDISCRRCGGTLEEADADEQPQRRPVVAVRSPVGGRHRLPIS
jgi:uncharacterized protein (DUF983 family)